MLKLHFYCLSVFISFTLLLLCNFDAAQAERHVKFLSTNCKFNPKYFKNFSIEIINNTLNMEMNLNKPIQRGFKAHMAYEMRLANAKSYQHIFSHLIDVCGVVTSVKESLFKNWFKDMAKYSNFMYNCPVEVGHYYLHNWRFGSAMTHQFLYPGEYRGNIYFFYGKYKSKNEEFVLTLQLESQLYN